MYWQYLIVALILLLAAVYVGRQVWRKVAVVRGKSDSGCETGCGKCGD